MEDYKQQKQILRFLFIPCDRSSYLLCYPFSLALGITCLQGQSSDTDIKYWQWPDVESLIKELEKIEGVQSVSKGRFSLSHGLAPTFQVWWLQVSKIAVGYSWGRLNWTITSYIASLLGVLIDFGLLCLLSSHFISILFLYN